LILLSALNIECEVYRFDDTALELWYQIPVAQLLDTNVMTGSTGDTVIAQYEYRLQVTSQDGSDSGMTEGKKNVAIVATGAPEEWLVTDYLPLTLYPGRFKIALLICAETDTGVYSDWIDVPASGNELCASDLMLGKKGSPEMGSYRGNNFLPSVNGHFSSGDTIFSFLELYGLQADSLYYDARYAIQDSSGKTFYSISYKRLKAGNVQQETLSLNLAVLVGGQFFLDVAVSDPGFGMPIERKKKFTIEYDVDLSQGRQFYENIEYLVSPKEFKRFKKLTAQEQKLYLKNFWSRHDYARFEERMLKANEHFSTKRIMGCDSYRGRYLIDHGEPEEREILPMHAWSRQLELWHYYSLGRDILFCDVKEDGNPQFIVELNIGELNQILEVGFADEDVVKKWPWLMQIAPGTYREKFRTDIESDEIQMQTETEEQNP
jgi:GWxTD domain-containing protein